MSWLNEHRTSLLTTLITVVLGPIIVPTILSRCTSITDPPQTHQPTSGFNALKKIRDDYKSYQLLIENVLTGNEYLEIKKFVVDEDNGSAFFDVPYRGGTRIFITHYSKEINEADGYYNISIVGLTTEVKFNMKFHSDGSANGKWYNFGKEGTFEIIKK